MEEKELLRERFKNYVATLADYGNIKIIDFRNPDEPIEHIRFIVDEDENKLHITGRLGELISCMEYYELPYDGFLDYDAFSASVICSSQHVYEYDKEEATKETEFLHLHVTALELAFSQLSKKCYGKNILLEELKNELSCRTLNAVKRAGVKTTMDFAYTTVANLKEFNQIGAGTIAEIETFCQKHGIEIGSKLDCLPSFEAGEKVYSLSDKTRPLEVKERAISLYPNSLPQYICTYTENANDGKGCKVQEYKCSIGELIKV